MRQRGGAHSLRAGDLIGVTRLGECLIELGQLFADLRPHAVEGWPVVANGTGAIL